MGKGRRELTKETKMKRNMAPEEIEKKKKRIVKVLITIVGIIVILIIAMIANEFIILDNNKTTNLVINNKNVTANLKNEVLIEDDIIYLSEADIANFFDKYIYADEENNQIITTYEKKIATIGFEKNTININGSDKKIYAHAIKKDETVYLPISEMKDVYDIEISNIEKTKVVAMDSLEKEQKRAIVTSDVAVKSSTNFISKTVDRIKKGDSVIVVSSNNGYTRIRTENGKLGYIKSNKLENEFMVRENMEEEKQIDGKVNLTWDYFSEYASAPDRSGTTIDGVNVVSPSFFYLDKNGNLRENIGSKGQAYIEWAHDNGYKVWAMFSNADAATESLSITSKIMNSYELRQELIESLVNKCVKYKLDGINIDFENMRQEDKDMFSRFIIELTPRLKEIGLVTSVDVTAPDGGETWSLCFDRNVIGNVADYIIFMAYDEYGVSSNKPGTTAGYDWVKLNLNKFLQTEEIESNKIILAIPFYTRVWTTNSDGKIVSRNTVSMKNIDKVLPDGVGKEWDDDLKQYYTEYTDGDNKKQIWIEDIESLKAKVSLIIENDLAGVGSWQKDMETDEVWKMLKEELK
ncbi:MAG: glycosyl hydrolase family 18 protein [Clostridia bacterium]